MYRDNAKHQFTSFRTVGHVTVKHRKSLKLIKKQGKRTGRLY